METAKQLDVAPAAKRDSHAFEIMRVWIAESGQHFSVRIGTWEDPAAWGLLLVDLARHIAVSHAAHYSVDSGATLQRIIAAWTVELNSPSDRRSD
jgi:hypothetical protein